jgi:hypothetical protein
LDDKWQSHILVWLKIYHNLIYSTSRRDNFILFIPEILWRPRLLIEVFEVSVDRNLSCFCRSSSLAETRSLRVETRSGQLCKCESDWSDRPFH